MSQRYPGGIINKNAPVVVGPTGSPPEGGFAPGIWTLEQAAGYIKQGLWPKPVLPRELYAWGQNNYGQLGLNDVANRSSPVQVNAFIDWSQVSAGSQFTVAIKMPGSLWSWGDNGSGQLGKGNVINQSSPVQVGALTDWAQVSAGGAASVPFCFALKTNGSLWSWGNNGSGQLGQNIAIATDRSSPVQVGALTDWAQVSAGGNFCAAVKTNGTLWSWGSSNSGRLGQGALVVKSSPAQVGALTDWAQVSGGFDFCAAVKTNGTLWSWGNNDNGQLGQNDLANRSSPVQVGALTDWAQVSAGRICAAVKTNGTLWTWGDNTFGQLGQNNLTGIGRSSPVQVGALNDWAQVSGGFNHCSAIKTNGTIWSWGRNIYGQLGQNIETTINRSSPVQVGSLTTWSIISQGSMAFSTLAITKG